MADMLDINLIKRRIDREFATANAKYGPPHFDIIVLENSRGDTIGDAQLLRRLRTLDRTGSFYQLVPKQVTLEE